MSENDDAPPTWRRWAKWSSARGWERFERPAPIEGAREEAPRRLRGSQAEPGHHLGRGTKWVKP